MSFVKIGIDHSIERNRIVSLHAYGSRPTIRLRTEFEQAKKVVDATNGEKIKTLLIADNGYLYLSSLKTDTLEKRVDKESE